MNIQKIGTTALLALAGALLAPSHANAALIYNDGDLILGFRGATQSYEVNVGQATTLLSASGPITLALGTSIKGDLDTLFPGWATSSSVLWSLSGTKAVSGGIFTSARNLFASRAQAVTGGVLGTQDSIAWNRGSLAGQGTPTNEMVELATKFAVGNNGTQTEAANGFSLIQANSETNSYRSYMPGGDTANSTASSAYKYFNGGIEANFGLGVDGAYLDLYDIRVGTGVSDFIGNVSIDATSGTVTFTPEGVPEPTTVASLGAGLALLISRRRRQTA